MAVFVALCSNTAALAVNTSDKHVRFVLTLHVLDACLKRCSERFRIESLHEKELSLFDVCEKSVLCSCGFRYCGCTVDSCIPDLLAIALLIMWLQRRILVATACFNEYVAAFSVHDVCHGHKLRSSSCQGGCTAFRSRIWFVDCDM
jgi:hypothetical protein